MSQRGVFNVGLAAFLVLGAVAVAVCLALWAHYETRHELDARQIAEWEGKYKKAHGDLTTCTSEAVTLRITNAEIRLAVNDANKALREVTRERDEGRVRWKAEEARAERERAAASARIASLMSRVAPVEFVKQCEALEALRKEYVAGQIR